MIAQLVERGTINPHVGGSIPLRGNAFLFSSVYIFLFSTYYSRVLYLEKCRWWGDWDIEWDVLLEDIIGVPAVQGTRMIFKVKQVREEPLFYVYIWIRRIYHVLPSHTP